MCTCINIIMDNLNAENSNFKDRYGESAMFLPVNVTFSREVILNFERERASSTGKRIFKDRTYIKAKFCPFCGKEYWK